MLLTRSGMVVNSRTSILLYRHAFPFENHFMRYHRKVNVLTLMKVN